MSTLFSLMYKEYTHKLMQKILPKYIVKPYMRNREIEMIRTILRKVEPASCLEWGSGYSTLYFPRFLGSNATWISIEHESKWAAKIMQMNKNPQVKIYLVEPNHFPWTDSHGDGAYSDVSDYIEFPGKFGRYDFILVDGRARTACLEKAYQLVTDTGVVVLHDAIRAFYHGPLVKYPYQMLFTDYHTDSHGLWIGSKGTPIEQILATEQYRKIWQICKSYGSYLKI